jgi:hypothetical protein
MKKDSVSERERSKFPTPTNKGGQANLGWDSFPAERRGKRMG